MTQAASWPSEPTVSASLERNSGARTGEVPPLATGSSRIRPLHSSGNAGPREARFGWRIDPRRRARLSETATNRWAAPSGEPCCTGALAVAGPANGGLTPNGGGRNDQGLRLSRKGAKGQLQAALRLAPPPAYGNNSPMIPIARTATASAAAIDRMAASNAPAAPGGCQLCPCALTSIRPAELWEAVDCESRCARQCQGSARCRRPWSYPVLHSCTLPLERGRGGRRVVFESCVSAARRVAGLSPTHPSGTMCCVRTTASHGDEH